MEVKKDIRVFIISFLVFSVFRILIPNMILDQETDMKKVIITSVFFGIAVLANRNLMSTFLK